MIRFETRDGQLFEMIDPVPLTKESEMPCLVQLTNDDSRLGKLNLMLHEDDCDKVYLCTSCNELVCHILVEGEEFDDFYPKYEIIGIPVPEGSAMWAWYQMQCGKMLTIDDDFIYRICNGWVQEKSLSGINVWENCYSVQDSFLKYCPPTGWKLYEPEHKSNKVQGCDPCSLSITDLTVIVGTCLFNLAGKGEPSSFYLEGLEGDLRAKLSAIAEHKAEPIRIPEPAFKVGDWVLIEVSGVESQQLISRGALPDSINARGIEFYHDGFPVMRPLNAKIIRKLSPSEVKVDFGFAVGTISVSPGVGGEEFGWFEFNIVSSTNCISKQINMHISQISNSETRERVESLLKAQEGE